jgi:hypothetical protein
MQRAIKRAEKDECFGRMKVPMPEDEIIKIKADNKCLYIPIALQDARF